MLLHISFLYFQSKLEETIEGYVKPVSFKFVLFAKIGYLHILAVLNFLLLTYIPGNSIIFIYVYLICSEKILNRYPI